MIKAFPESQRPQRVIADRYLQGELSAAAAAAGLGSKGVFGRYLAAEILLEDLVTGERRLVPSRMDIVKNRYRGVRREIGRLEGIERLDLAPTRARTVLRAAQLDVVQELYHRRKSPEPGLVRGMYRRLLMRAVETAYETRPHLTDKRPSAFELRGILGEMAVLLLAQRAALHGQTPEPWLPLQSLFSQDRGASCLSDAGEFKWDMSIFTPAPSGLPNLTHRIQIKSLPDPEVPVRGPTVHIQPDLALYSGEPWITGEIITACGIEAADPGSKAAVSVGQALDQRTAQLLSVLQQG